MGTASVAVLLLVLGGCGGSDHPASAPAPSTTTVAPAMGGGPGSRHLTDAERAAMLQTLAVEAGPVRKVWFVVTPGDPEAAALKDSFEAVFKQAGWETATQPVAGMMLKPGLSILMAEEEPPSYVNVAKQALEATSFDWKSGSGYRAYAEERKRADPKWPGIPMGPEQDFVVVIGPKAPAPSAKDS